VPASAEIGNINTSFPGIESTPFLNGASPASQWVFTQAKGKAPAGTTQVLFFLLNVNPPGSATSMYLDDIEANLVGAPTLPVTLTATQVGNNIQISFPTQNGASYDVAYKVNLTDPNWTPIVTISGDGTTKTVSYPATAPSRFYMVRTP
jgi:hypothetical protein